MTIRRLLAFAMWGAFSFVASATATSLPISASTLGAATTAVMPCDGNGISLTYQLNGSEQLVSVTLSDISGGCAGGTARATLTNGATVLGSGTASLPSSGFSGSVVVALDSTVDPSSVTRTAVAVDGV